MHGEFPLNGSTHEYFSTLSRTRITTFLWRCWREGDDAVRWCRRFGDDAPAYSCSACQLRVATSLSGGTYRHICAHIQMHEKNINSSHYLVFPITSMSSGSLTTPVYGEILRTEISMWCAFRRVAFEKGNVGGARWLQWSIFNKKNCIV